MEPMSYSLDSLGKIFYTKEITKVMDSNKMFAMEVRICLERFCQKVMKSLSSPVTNDDELVEEYQTCEGDIYICGNPTIVAFAEAV